MSYRRPVPVLYWAPTIWPGGLNIGPYGPMQGIWADLSATEWKPFPLKANGKTRIVQFDSNRGRRSTTERMAAGTLTVTLNNSDGTLEPSKAGSTTNSKFAGIPFYLAMRDAAGAEHPIFAGLLDSPWKPSWGPGRARSVEITITDYYGYSAHMELPGSCANFATRSYAPGGADRVWWRGPMNGQLATVANNVTVWDFGDPGVNGRLSAGSAGAADPFTGCDQPALAVASGGSIYRPGAAFDPGDLVFAWCAYDIPHAPASSNLILMGCRGLPSGLPLWQVGMNTTGRLFIAIYNSAGTGVGLLASAGSYLGKQMVGAQIAFNTRSMTLVTPLGRLSGTWSSPSGGSKGRLTIESVPTQGLTVSEWSVGGLDYSFNRVSDMTGTEPITMSASSGDLYTVDVPPSVARPADFPTLTSTISTFTPQQAFFDAAADAFGGVIWCRRDGQIVWRAAQDLGYWPASRGTNNAVTDNVHQVVARLTDAPTPATYTGATTHTTYAFPIIRYSGDGHSGPDPDRVVNTATIGNARFYNMASRRRFGERADVIDGTGKAVIAGDIVAVAAQQKATQLASPTDAAEAVVLQPDGDATITTFVLETLELEARVLLTQSDPDTAAPILTDVPMRVQSEAWSWADAGNTWTVTLSLDVPVPNA